MPMEEQTKIPVELDKILKEYRATPIDRVDQRKLREWGIVLSSELIYLGQEVIKAEHNYWREIGKARIVEGVKSKADAEIAANGTEAYKDFRMKKYLHDDLCIMLGIIRRFWDKLEEEKYEGNRI